MTRAAGFEEEGRPFLGVDVDEQPTEFLFDVDLMARMDEAGLFGPIGKRVELRQGRLVIMAPVGTEHGFSTPKVTYELIRLLKALGLQDLSVVQGTLTLARREAPIPDAAVIRGGAAGPYFVAEQALLVVEVSKSTLRDDLTYKLNAYARAGAPEYWVVDVQRRRLHLFRTPQGGAYADTDVLDDTDRVSPLFAESRGDIAVADLF